MPFLYVSRSVRRGLLLVRYGTRTRLIGMTACTVVPCSWYILCGTRFEFSRFLPKDFRIISCPIGNLFSLQIKYRFTYRAFQYLHTGTVHLPVYEEKGFKSRYHECYSTVKDKLQQSLPYSTVLYSLSLHQFAADSTTAPNRLQYSTVL